MKPRISRRWFDRADNWYWVCLADGDCWIEAGGVGRSPREAYTMWARNRLYFDNVNRRA